MTDFFNDFVSASLVVLKGLLKIILIPYNLYCKIMKRLISTEGDSSLSLQQNSTAWPMLSHIKRVVLDFLLDALSVLSWPLLLLWTIINLIRFKFSLPLDVLLYWLLIIYMCPVIIALIRDLIQIIVLPIKKFIDWAKKPAQQLHVDVKNH